MPKPSNQKKLLLRIGVQPFLDAQDGLCPLCGIGEFEDKPEPTSISPSGEKCYDFIPYYSPTWDHVVPEAKGGKFFGNTLVVHNGCNSRKAKSLPMPHEIAVLKLVNERLGWDGVTYGNTVVGRKLYEHMQQVTTHAGFERLVELCDEPLMIRNFILRRAGIIPTPPPLTKPNPRSEEFYPPKRKKKPSKGVLIAQKRHDHLVIRPSGTGGPAVRAAAAQSNA